MRITAKEVMMEVTIVKDRQDLERLEGVIQQNLQSFFEVGRALMEIRDRELYKIKNGGDYATFEAYCRGEWDFSRRHAYRFIDSAKVIENVTDRSQTKPENLEQTRPLARLEPEKQKVAWQKAVETAPEGKVTAAHVQKVVREMVEPASKPKQQEIKVQFTNAMKIASFVVSHLERLMDHDPEISKALDRVQRWIDNKRSTQREMIEPASRPSLPKSEPEPEKRHPCHAVYFAISAISHLERIANDDPTKSEALDQVQEWIDRKRKEWSI